MADEAIVELGRFPVGDGEDPSTIMSRIREAVGEAFPDGDGARRGSSHKAVDPATALPILGEAFQRYTRSYGVHQSAKCPFKPGDVVTPQAAAALTHVGLPHIVLETRTCDPDFEHMEDAPTSNSFGCRRDMRVACVVKGTVSGRPGTVAHWVESFEFVPYAPE